MGYVEEDVFNPQLFIIPADQTLLAIFPALLTLESERFRQGVVVILM